jgi:NitT/TauT family transport system permease protein
MSTMTATEFQEDAEVKKLVDETLRARRSLKLQSILFGIGFPLALLALWQIAASTGMIDRRFFPAPTTIAHSIFYFLSNPADRALLGGHILRTLSRLAIGYGIGASAGVTLGVIMGLSTRTRFAVSPLLFMMFPMPKIAIYPLMIVIFGIGDASSAALVTLGVFFMTTINTLSGVLYTNPIYHDVSTAFHIPPLTRWFRVFIPSAMPSIMTGLRLGIGQALILVISSEFVSADNGVGRFIWDSWQVLDIAQMFMGLSIVLLLAGIAAVVGDYAERKLIPWKVR